MARCFPIICTGGTGSTLLGHTLEACGVELGGEEVFRDRAWKSEHHLLNNTLPLLQNNERVPVGWTERWLSDISFEADWVTELIFKLMSHQLSSPFGFKVTNGLKPGIFHIFKDMIEKNFQDISYVTVIRNPAEDVLRFMGMKKNGVPVRDGSQVTPNRVSTVEEYLAIGKVRKEFFKESTVFRYPEDWEDGTVETKVKSLGLEWNAEAYNLYDSEKVTKVDREKKRQFINEYPEIFELYYELIEIGENKCHNQ